MSDIIVLMKRNAAIINLLVLELVELNFMVAEK